MVPFATADFVTEEFFSLLPVEMAGVTPFSLYLAFLAVLKEIPAPHPLYSALFLTSSQLSVPVVRVFFSLEALQITDIIPVVSMFQFVVLPFLLTLHILSVPVWSNQIHCG